MTPSGSRWHRVGQDDAKWVKMTPSGSRWHRVGQDDAKWVKMTDGTVVEQVVADADGVDDVDCEEWNPAEHEHAWQHDSDI